MGPTWPMRQRERRLGPLAVRGTRLRAAGLGGCSGWAGLALGFGPVGPLPLSFFFFVLFFFFYLFSVFLTLPFDFYSVLIQNFSVEIYKIFI